MVSASKRFSKYVEFIWKHTQKSKYCHISFSMVLQRFFFISGGEVDINALIHAPVQFARDDIWQALEPLAQGKDGYKKHPKSWVLHRTGLLFLQLCCSFLKSSPLSLCNSSWRRKFFTRQREESASILNVWFCGPVCWARHAEKEPEQRRSPARSTGMQETRVTALRLTGITTQLFKCCCQETLRST